MLPGRWGILETHAFESGDALIPELRYTDGISSRGRGGWGTVVSVGVALGDLLAHGLRVKHNHLGCP